MGKYDKLYELVEKLEEESKNLGAINSAVAVLKEIVNNIDNNGILPLKSKGYIEEKFRIIMAYIRK